VLVEKFLSFAKAASLPDRYHWCCAHFKSGTGRRLAINNDNDHTLLWAKRRGQFPGDLERQFVMSHRVTHTTDHAWLLAAFKYSDLKPTDHYLKVRPAGRKLE